MALIKCEECGCEYSDQRNRCVHCGYAPKKRIRDQKRPAMHISKKMIFLFGSIVFVALIIFVSIHIIRAKPVVDSINALDELTVIKQTDLDDIKGKLSIMSKSTVMFVTNKQILDDAQHKIDTSAAAKTDEAITAIGDVTLESGENISVAEELYSSLTKAQQALVTKDADLIAARKLFDTLPIPLSLKNIEDYSQIDIQFTDFTVRETGVFFTTYEASATMVVTITSLQNVTYENAALELHCFIEGTGRGLAIWGPEDIQIKLPPDGNTSITRQIMYELVFPTGAPHLKNSEYKEIVKSVSGNIIK